MKRQTGFVIPLIVVSALLFVAIERSEGQEFGKDSLRVRGSRSVASRINLFAKEYLKDFPKKTIVVIGGDTQKGFQQFLEGHAEIVMMSRRLTDKETKSAENAGMQLIENQAGAGSVVLVVNPSNPVSDLTIEQARKILLGNYTNWKQVGGKDAPLIVIAMDSTDSDTRGFLSEKLLGGKELLATAETRPTYEAVLRKISKEKNAFGFARASDIYRLRRAGGRHSVKVLGLRMREGTQVFLPVTKIAGGHTRTYYPLEQSYFLYYDSKRKGSMTGDFANFCEKQIITNPGDYLDEGLESPSGKPASQKPVDIIEPTSPGTAQAGLTILLVTDLPDTAKRLTTGLTQAGQKVLAASSGKDALAACEKGPVDVVLCASQQSSVPCERLSRSIDEYCRKKNIAKIPFIALVKPGERDSLQKRTAALGTRLVERPVDAKSLLTVIQGFSRPAAAK